MIGFLKLSGYQDSNLGPPAPKAGALTGLRYTPNDLLYVFELRVQRYCFFLNCATFLFFIFDFVLFFLVKYIKTEILLVVVVLDFDFL